MYPGQLPTVKLNSFNNVLVVDLSQSSTLNFFGMIGSIIDRGFGFRWGVVPIVETEDGTVARRRVVCSTTDTFEQVSRWLVWCTGSWRMSAQKKV